MIDRNRRRRRIAARVALAMLLAVVALVPRAAGATTQTKFYSANATWSTTPAFVGVADTATVVFANEPYSTQSFGSAQLTFNSIPPSAVQVVQSSLPSGWSAQVLKGSVAVIRLTSLSGAAIVPGRTLTVQVEVTPTAAGTLTLVPQVKQSNNFSGTGNDFILDGSSGLTITVVALSLQFAQEPSATIGQSLPGATPPYVADFCNAVSVQLYNGATPVAAPGVPVTITYAGTADPGLYFDGAAVTAPGATADTDPTGLATFGDCSTGLGATVVGLSFALSASSPAAASAVTSTSFQVLETCIGSCTNNDKSNTTGTSATVNASDTGIFQIFTAFGQGVVLSCDVAVTKPGTPVDPLFAETQTTSGTVSGTLTMVFPKSVVNSLANNGTPLMQVCAGASEPFPAKGDPSTGLPWPGSTAFPYQGLLYDCTDSTYLALVATDTFPVQMCVQSRAKIGGGAERIVVFASDLSDPSFW
ncbi:MAG TPA: hypothetical protein VFC09_12010 [Candidatus Dormibacteraeota bacterium]|nr:hypothetical protein [Candidatus Dormibacteraeota bacterium]